MLKTLRERMKTVDYAYIAFPNKEECIEIEDPDVARIYARTFGGIYYDHFPYAEYGFEDPYNFANTWVITNMEGDIIEYNVEPNGEVKEVIADVL